MKYQDKSFSVGGYTKHGEAEHDRIFKQAKKQSKKIPPRREPLSAIESFFDPESRGYGSPE